MKERKENLEIRIDDAKITFRNFTGAEAKFNPAGNRNFCVFLPDDVARKMEADGWNIKWLNNPNYPPQAIITVKLNFGNYPPKVILVSDGQMSQLNEANVNLLDFAELKQVDLIIRGYEWGPIQGKTGIKAYLKTGYFVLVVDELAKKYSQALDSAQSAIGGCGNCEVCDGSCGGGLSA